MNNPRPTKILVVDDLPEKILVYLSILEEEGREIVVARSGAEALKAVLDNEFAVILLDVNMPGMDGFETAGIIRSRKRSMHTPIIFITSHSDEMRAIEGYAQGAVDYILAPVVPKILRTKVNVFVQLFRLTQQVVEQATERVALAEREREHISDVLERSIDFVAQVDPNGAIIRINPAGRAMLGFSDNDTPRMITHVLPNDAASEMIDRWLPAARSDGFWFGDTTMRTRGGDMIAVAAMILPRQANDGRTERFSIVARDISERKRAEEVRSLLAAIVDSTEDAIISKTTAGIITACNPAAEHLFERKREELVGQSMTLLIPPEWHPEEQRILERLRAGEHVQSFETVRLTKNGRRIDVSLTVSPVRDAAGVIVGASSIARDITERKRSERELHRYREELEELVRERTEELEASLQRLRLADRMVSIGTLAAGLGHDMGNLLLPLRMRLDVLEAMDLPPVAKTDLQAISSACNYLRRLSQGLRLFALDPDEPSASGTHTTIEPWWEDVALLLRNALPEGVELERRFEVGLPPIAMSPHVFTQVVYNLVQNAGDAMQDRISGRVAVHASCDDGSRTIVIEVVDDGPGMDDEARRRCIEPFFTTKTRSLSTGLGLVLVCSAVRDANGTIDVESQLGVGTTVRVTIPIWESCSVTPIPVADAACVDIRDSRMRAFITSLLVDAGVHRITNSWSPTETARLVVVDGPNTLPSELGEFLNSDPTRQAIVFGEHASDGSAVTRAVYVEEKPSASKIRGVLLAAIAATTAAVGESHA